MPKRVAQTKAFEALGRIGWMAKGVVYTTIGYVAMRVAAGVSEEDADIQGALSTLADEPLGGPLLWVMVVGFVGYALWRISVAVFDSEEHGRDVVGIASRAGFASVGLFYGFVAAWLGSSLLAGDTQPENNGEVSEWATRILEVPAGPWLIGTVALGFFAAAFVQFYRAYSAPYEDHFDEDRMTGFSDRYGRWIGRAGVASRGIAFVGLGYFLSVAVIADKPEEARDLGEALIAIADEPILLDVIAVGFFAYGFHCLQNARYRRIRPSDDD